MEVYGSPLLFSNQKYRYFTIVAVFVETFILGVLFATKIRYNDQSFPPSLIVSERNVSCSQYTGGVYPERTWTCSDIRVDGLPIVFGYSRNMSSELCSDNDGRDNVAVICLEMLRSISIPYPLWAATISKFTCNKTTSERVSFVEVNDRQFEWQKMGPGFGWIDAIHCTILPDVV